MKKYILNWIESVEKAIVVEANNEEDAKAMFFNNTENLSDNAEIINYPDCEPQLIVRKMESQNETMDN